MQNLDSYNTRMLINESHICWDKFLDRYSPAIEHFDITNKFNRIALIGNLSNHIYDIYLFDIDGNVRGEISFLNKLKRYNPGMSTIIVTSEKNRKYRSQLAIDIVDHFIFRESDMDLLNQVISRINHRITRTRTN
jgi:DNA-binding NarL/FixJ family response regulator